MIDALAVFLADEERARLDEQVAVIAGEIDGGRGDAIVAALGLDEVRRIVELAAAQGEALKPLRSLLADDGDLAKVTDGVDETLSRLDVANTDLDAPKRLLGLIPQGRVADRYFKLFAGELTTLRSRGRFLVECGGVVDRLDALANTLWARLAELAHSFYGLDQLASGAPADQRLRARLQDVRAVAEIATVAYAEARRGVDAAAAVREALRGAGGAIDAFIHAAAILADALQVAPLNGQIADDERRDAAAAKTAVVAELAAARAALDRVEDVRGSTLSVTSAVMQRLTALAETDAAAGID